MAVCYVVALPHPFQRRDAELAMASWFYGWDAANRIVYVYPASE